MYWLQVTRLFRKFLNPASAFKALVLEACQNKNFSSFRTVDMKAFHRKG
jgi:hypothetical protein